MNVQELTDLLQSVEIDDEVRSDLLAQLRTSGPIPEVLQRVLDVLDFYSKLAEGEIAYYDSLAELCGKLAHDLVVIDREVIGEWAKAMEPILIEAEALNAKVAEGDDAIDVFSDQAPQP